MPCIELKRSTRTATAQRRFSSTSKDTVACLFALYSATISASDAPPDSESLLAEYFRAASVCSTAEVSSIKEQDGLIKIRLLIESATRNGIRKLNAADRNDWFSLHCPPESHRIWSHSYGLHDIIVSGLLSNDEDYQLSCVNYYQTASRRMQSATSRVQQQLNRLLGR